MKLTKEQHTEFAKGYQAQHDDMFESVKEEFSTIQQVILDHEFDPFKEPLDYEDFGRDAFLYKLEAYINQTRFAREIQGLTNSKQRG